MTYCASLEAWNLNVAGQHLNASNPRSSVWPNSNITIFSGFFFGQTLNCHYSLTVKAFDLIPKLRARPEYHLSFGSKYTSYTSYFLGLLTHMGKIWYISGIHLGYTWELYKTYLWHIWDISETYVGDIRGIFGRYLGHIKDISETLSQIWFVLNTNGFVQNMTGLAKIWLNLSKKNWIGPKYETICPYYDWIYPKYALVCHKYIWSFPNYDCICFRCN